MVLLHGFIGGERELHINLEGHVIGKTQMSFCNIQLFSDARFGFCFVGTPHGRLPAVTGQLGKFHFCFISGGVGLIRKLGYFMHTRKYGEIASSMEVKQAHR